MNPAEITAAKNRMTVIRDEFNSWFAEADKKGQAMGPSDIDHVALNTIADKVGSLEVVYEGLEKIAPDLEEQTKYVLEKLADGVSTLIAETRDMYGTFQSFAASGPQEKLSSLDSYALKKFAENRKSDFIQHSLDLQKNTVNIYLATGSLENAETMLKVQLAIKDKHTAFDTRLGRNDLKSLHREVKALVERLGEFREKSEELVATFRSDSSDYSKILTKYKTITTTNQLRDKDKLVRSFDKDFFNALHQYLEVMKELHDCEPVLSELMLGLDEVLGNEKPPLEDLQTSVVQDMHLSMGRTLRSIDSEALTAATDFGKTYERYEDRVPTPLGDAKNIVEVMELNVMVTENIRDLLRRV